MKSSFYAAEQENSLTDLNNADNALAPILKPLPLCEPVKSWEYKLWDRKAKTANNKPRHKNLSELHQMVKAQNMPSRRDELNLSATGAIVPYKPNESLMQLIPYVEPTVTLDDIIKPSPKGVFKQSYPEEFSREGDFLTALCKEAFYVRKQAPQFDFLTAPISKSAYSSMTVFS